MLTFPSFSKAFATLLNLANETNSSIDTSPLEGRSFAITIDELPQDMGIRVENGKIIALTDEEVCVADVTISGNVKAIIHMIQDEEAGLDSDELYISGKISAARNFQHYLASLSIDWKGFFGKFLPDEIATKTATIVEQSIDFTQSSIEQLSGNIKKYLLEEKQIVLTRPTFEAWQSDIASLHTRIDSLLNGLK